MEKSWNISMERLIKQFDLFFDITDILTDS